VCVSTFGRELLKDYKPPCRSLTTPFVHHHHYRQYRRRRRSFGFLLLIFPVCRNAPADPLAPAIQPYCPGGDGWAVKRANCVDDGAICDETIILWATSVCVCVCVYWLRWFWVFLVQFARLSVFSLGFSAFVHTFLARVIIIALVYVIFDDDNIRRIQAMR